MVSKWSSEDVVKFLDVYEESEDLWNIRHSDYNNQIKRDSAMLKLMGALLKRNVAVENVEVLRKKIISSSIAFPHIFPKVTDKVNRFPTLVAIQTYPVTYLPPRLTSS